VCNGFGLIVDKNLYIYFVEPDATGDCSHSDILRRLGWRENVNRFLRNFVRVEFSDWTPESFSFDEDSSLPGWAEENKQEIKDKCIHALELCAPAWAEYEKVRAPALAEYEKVRDPALAEYEKVRDLALAEYEKVRNLALAEYEKVRDPALAEYKKVLDLALAEYKKVRDPALAEYEKVRDPALAEYEKVRDPALAEFVATLSKIKGYVKEPE
jgi:hypothetical protein